MCKQSQKQADTDRRSHGSMAEKRQSLGARCVVRQVSLTGHKGQACAIFDHGGVVIGQVCYTSMLVLLLFPKVVYMNVCGQDGCRSEQTSPCSG